MQRLSMCDVEGRTPEVVTSYSQHGSLVYGADWCRSSVGNLPELTAGYDSAAIGYDSTTGYDPAGDAGENPVPDSGRVELQKESSSRGRRSRSWSQVAKDDELIASCSFYDRQLRIWALNGGTCAMPTHNTCYAH